MSQIDTSERSESSLGTERAEGERSHTSVSKVVSSLRWGLESGAVTAIAGGVGLLGGLRALQAGERKRGIAGLSLGAAFLAVAVAQRRSRGSERETDVDETDVAGTGSDVETIADEAGGVGEEDHAAGQAASAVVETSPDVDEVGSGRTSESDTGSESIDQRDVADTSVDSQDLAEATDGEIGDGAGEIGHEDVDRLGEAAFDGQSQEVPAPQRAFNQGFLAHSTEVFWGVRGRDDAVVVSQDYDAVEGRDGVRYVASSEIGDDVRELSIPSAVLDHWGEVYGGGTALSSGDDILFVTTDDLAAGDLLCVLPAAWADGIFGDPE